MVRFRQVAFNLIYFLNVLLIFLLVFEDKIRLPIFLQVTGRMHPMVMHFPIVLLFVGIFLEWLKTKKKFQHPTTQDIVEYVFCFFALGSAFTALFGLFLFKEGSYSGDEITLHKWLGAVVSLMALPILWMISKPAARKFYLGTLGICALIVTVAGHVGSEVTHGKGFVTEPIRKFRQANMVKIAHADSAIVFRDVIQPILNEKCIQCHNSNRAKNNLILSDFNSVIKGGENKGSVVAGKADESLMFRYISLPMNDTLHMPPSGKLQLDREEIKLIGWWINTGASADKKYVTIPKVDSIHTIMLSKFQPKKGLDLVDISFVPTSIVNDLNNPYRTVQQISDSKPYIAVFLGSKKDFSQQDLLELKGIADQVISIDLGNSNVSNKEVEALARFPHLQKLHLQNNPIEDGAMTYLRDLRFLETLNLSGTKISDATLLEITGWKQLKKLYLYNTAITPSAIESLNNGHGDIRVYNTQFDLADSVYNAQLIIPVSKIDSLFFRTHSTIEIKPSRGKVKYYYTLDGNEPTSQSTLYTEPFMVRQTSELKFIAVMAGWMDSKATSFQLLKIGLKPDEIIFESKPNEKSLNKSDSVLVDGKAGSLDHGDKAYVSFVGQDFQVVLRFKSSVKLSQLTMSFLEDFNAGIFRPEYLEAWGGESINTLSPIGKTIASFNRNKAPASKGLITLKFSERSVRFVRIKAKNIGALPSIHPLAKKTKARIAIDEVSVE